jgi:hypothetical protein
MTREKYQPESWPQQKQAQGGDVATYANSRIPEGMSYGIED